MRLYISLILIVITNLAIADDKNEGWIFTPAIGVNRLALDNFYDTVYNAPFIGTAQITVDLPEDVEGESSYPSERFYFENRLERTMFDIEASLEMRRNFGERNDFFIGINAWETSAEAQPITVTFPLQGDPNNRALYTRSATLSYTQYYLGLRHYLTNRERKFTLYLNLSIHEIYDVDYEEKNIFEFIIDCA